MEVETNKAIGTLWPIINRIDLDSHKFSLEKAYLCCRFSELAYQHIPEYELKESDRIKIVPSEKYIKQIKMMKVIDVKSILRNADFGDSFIIERRFAVVVGVKIGKVIVIAIRGTKEMYDWLVNFNVVKYIYNRNRHQEFHLGFYKAIVSCYDAIFREISGRLNDDTHILITGHSLGGAMAAILNTLFHTNHIDRNVHCINPFRVNSCYTFGMPRYGTIEAVEIQPPYHLYNENDIVPTLPPTWLGYSSCPREYQLNGKNIELKTKRETLAYANWIMRLILNKRVPYHGIELYEQNILDELLKINPQFPERRSSTHL